MASMVPWTVSRLFGQLVASRQRTGVPVCAIAGPAIAVAAVPATACLRKARLFISALPAGCNCSKLLDVGTFWMFFFCACAVNSRPVVRRRDRRARLLQRMGALKHDPEKACPGLDPGCAAVFGKDHAQQEARAGRRFKEKSFRSRSGPSERRGLQTH